MSETNTQENFLLKEYDSAVSLTFHVDDLRAKLTSFFVAFGGIAAAGLIVLLKGEAVAPHWHPAGVVSLLMALVGFIGGMVICIVARLRRVQIEHFRIINNIREHFLKNNENLQSVVELSTETLPVANRRSGSYYWVLILIVISSFYLTFACFSYIHFVREWLEHGQARWLPIILFIIVGIILDKLYFRLVTPVTSRSDHLKDSV